MNVRIDLGGIGAHIVVDVDFDAAASYSLAIFTSDVIEAVAVCLPKFFVVSSGTNHPHSLTTLSKSAFWSTLTSSLL